MTDIEIHKYLQQNGLYWECHFVEVKDKNPRLNTTRAIVRTEIRKVMKGDKWVPTNQQNNILEFWESDKQPSLGDILHRCLKYLREDKLNRLGI